MAFEADNLSVISYANGFTLWHYRTSDAATMNPSASSSYFLRANDLIRAGDLIILQMELYKTDIRLVTGVSSTGVTTKRISNAL
ncbi:MAG: hypothetical protein OD811_05815 [Alphaproteobacteria bacterium]